MHTNDTKRVPNFSPAEKRFLINLIAEKYANVLEDKKTNRVSIQDKTIAWKQIEEEFNSSGPLICYRNAESLRSLYENRKKDLRKKMAEEKRERFATGGTIPVVKKDDTDGILISILNKKTLEGLENRFDSNADLTIQKSQPEDNTICIYGENNNNESQQILGSASIEYMESNNIDDASELNITEVAPQKQNGETSALSKQLNTCKKYKPIDLQTPIDPALKVNNHETELTTPHGSKNHRSALNSGLKRKRSASSVRALTSSHIAEKYNVLVQKRLVLVNKQIKEIVDRYPFQREKEKVEIQAMKNTEENTRLKIQDLKSRNCC